MDKALTVLANLFRGATAYPRGRGIWRDDDRGGTLVTDEPTIVISYADPKAVTPVNLHRLRAFLHRMGREARQGEVGIVTSFCARLYGRRSARNRAQRALEAASRNRP